MSDYDSCPVKKKVRLDIPEYFPEKRNLPVHYAVLNTRIAYIFILGVHIRHKEGNLFHEPSAIGREHDKSPLSFGIFYSPRLVRQV
jgi:hypothetical protein